MKNQHQASRNAGKKSTSTQSANAPKSSPGETGGVPRHARPSTPITPSVAAVRMADALELYRCSLDGAGSLALLNLANIQWGENGFAGWEQFSLHPRFKDGISEVIRAALNHAYRVVDDTERTYSPMLERLHQHSYPAVCAPVTFEQRLAALAEYGYSSEADKIGELDDGFLAMNDLLEILGVTLSERAPENVGYFIAAVVKDTLKESHDALFKAAKEVQDAAVALEYGAVQKEAA